ncbi:MAG: 16S rRNA (guanine(527)-N(7))-methyltransferase RsmG [Woeseiaceae bacterium]|nr:16S rRNA (guanine(527)-N(7))-methyltransferase RsmG [Woeseiaceae bacterium]
MNDIDDRIAAGVATLGQVLPNGASGQLARLLSELERWNRRLNLTAIRDPREMVSAHVLDSLALRPYLEGTRVLDVGTGAGFPGLPLAIAEPQRQFLLLDSNARKIAFVKHMIADLALGNVTAIQARVEDLTADRLFDTVLARALATLVRIVELCAHLVAENGVLLAAKGKYPAEELADLKKPPADWDFRVIELQVPDLPPQSRHLVKLQRTDRS